MSYRIEEVSSSGSADFAEAYAALDAEFGARGELERREVVERWLDEPRSAAPHDGRAPDLQRRYLLLLARDEHGALAGVRDCHVVVELAERIVLVYLAHSLVLPAYRRTGLAALFRSEPLARARDAAKQAGLSDGAFELLLAAEMEPAVESDPASLVRLVAYGRAGFAAIAPAALPYCQPDFGERAVPLPIPLLAVVSWIGHEGATSLPKRLARAYLRHLHAVFATHVRADHLAALERATLCVLDAVATDDVPLLPLPRTTDDREAFAPLEREAVLSCFRPASPPGDASDD